MIDIAEIFLTKAEESLAGAESELASARYNNCANRCYFACFQAAVAALMREGIRPTEPRAEWGHAFVQARFAGDLINRRKRYPPSLRDVLGRSLFLRQAADYKSEHVTLTQASRAVRSTRLFLEAIRIGGAENR